MLWRSVILVCVLLFDFVLTKCFCWHPFVSEWIGLSRETHDDVYKSTDSTFPVKVLINSSSSLFVLFKTRSKFISCFFVFNSGALQKWFSIDNSAPNQMSGVLELWCGRSSFLLFFLFFFQFVSLWLTNGFSFFLFFFSSHRFSRLEWSPIPLFQIFKQLMLFWKEKDFPNQTQCLMKSTNFALLVFSSFSPLFSFSHFIENQWTAWNHEADARPSFKQLLQQLTGIFRASMPQDLQPAEEGRHELTPSSLIYHNELAKELYYFNPSQKWMIFFLLFSR